MSIHILEPVVASKIAAGEVVERPASVVKELIENAIDAGASQVRVEIRNGGLHLIRVIDDGEGISPDELETAFERHATSKIRSADDLFHISTLGFRGEALPSIAAVAEVTVVTRTQKDLAGSFITMREGYPPEKGRRGAAPGTAISVHNLFNNIPARLKFLKGTSSETSRINTVITHYAMAYPMIKFSFINEGRLAFQTSGSGELRDVLAKVYSAEVAAEMLEVITENSESGKIAIRGYVSSPNITRATRGYLSFFVNGRWVQNRVLSYAVEEAYHSLLPIGRHPLAVLSVEVPASEIDVNVHPAKTEIKFVNEREVFITLQKTVRQIVTSQMTVPVVVQRATTAGQDIQHHFQPTMNEFATSSTWSPPETKATKDIQALPTMGERLPVLRVMGQVSGMFIIAEGPKGVYLIDQHRAHERVLYEHLVAEAEGAPINQQMLLTPLTVELTTRQMAVLPELLTGLTNIGFDLEPFGEQAVLIRAVPAILVQSDVTRTLSELLDQAVDNRAPSDWVEKIRISMACRGAIKSGQPLTLSEMRELVMQLEKTSTPSTCPHGSPVMVHLSQEELQKQFGRR